MNEDVEFGIRGEQSDELVAPFLASCAFALDTNPNLLLGLRTELTSARVPTAPPLPLSVSPRLLFLFRDEAEGVASSYIFVTVVADAAARRESLRTCANIGACAFTASDSDNASSAVGPRENGSVPALAKTSAANLRTNTPDGKISNSSSASPRLTPNGNASGEIESILRTSTMDFSISPQEPLERKRVRFCQVQDIFRSFDRRFVVNVVVVVVVVVVVAFCSVG